MNATSLGRFVVEDDNVDWGVGVAGALSRHDPEISALSDDMLNEIAGKVGLRDLIALIGVCERFHSTLRSHPFIQTRSAMTSPKCMVDLTSMLGRIQELALPFRTALMREYAFLMRPVSDGNASAVWNSAIQTETDNLSIHEDADVRWSGLRDLCIAKPNVFTRVVEVAAKNGALINACEDSMAQLPRRYQADVIGALLRFNPGTSYDRYLPQLLLDIDLVCDPPPLHVTAVLAVLTLFDERSDRVCESLSRRFSITPQQRTMRFAQMVAEALALRFPCSDVALSGVLLRWGRSDETFLSSLHDAFIAKAAASRHTPMKVVYLDGMTSMFPSQDRLVERALGLPRDAVVQQGAIRAVMALFWRVYWLREADVAVQGCRAIWLSVLAMPWQVQATLLGRLACREDVQRSIGSDWWGDKNSLDQWERYVVDVSVAHDLPRLAVRALTVGCNLLPPYGNADLSIRLRRAWRIALESAPEWSWEDLIPQLCARRSSGGSNAGDYWPQDADVKDIMTRYLCHDLARMTEPSQAFLSTLVQLAPSLWDRIPDHAIGERSQIDVFCDRFDLLPVHRHSLRRALRGGPAGDRY